MSAISQYLHYGDAFIRGSSIGYKAVSKLQAAANIISGQWIGRHLCQVPPLKQIVKFAGSAIARPVQAVVSKVARNSVEKKLRKAVDEALTSNVKSGVGAVVDFASRQFSSPFLSSVLQGSRQFLGNTLNEKLQDEIVSRSMRVIDEFVTKNNPEIVKNAMANLSQYAVELVLGNQIYQYSLQMLAQYLESENENDSAILSVVNTANDLSSFTATAAVTMGVGMAYLIPVAYQRCSNRSQKDRLKRELSLAIQENLNSINTLPNSTAKIIADNIADVCAESFL